jgi:hypothetical protein
MDFVSREICRGAYGPIELERMEADVLRALDWRLAGPTSQDFVDAILDLLPGGAAAADDDGGASTRRLLALAAKALAAKAHAEAAMLDHRMAAMPGSSVACAALLASAGGAPGALLAALGPEDLAAWADRVAATGSGGEAMDRVFAEGLADVARRGWSAPADVTMRSPPSTPPPRSSPAFVGGAVGAPGRRGGGGAPGSVGAPPRASATAPPRKGPTAAANKDAAAHRRSPTSSIAWSSPTRGIREWCCEDDGDRAIVNGRRCQRLDGPSPVGR